jgi:hypothetical protein
MRIIRDSTIFEKCVQERAGGRIDNLYALLSGRDASSDLRTSISC